MSTDIYNVKKIKDEKQFTVTVPGSKSVTNRALMLAALAEGSCLLKGVLFSDDSRAFLDCLEKLGFQMKINEDEKTVEIQGSGGLIPNRTATVNVRSAGTAARFLTVMLAVAGGTYHMESSEQMKKRPMEPLLSMLREAGITIECLEKEGHFPFLIKSDGLKAASLSIDTEISSQFASALLMAGSFLKGGLQVTLLGSRTEGAYIQITRKMLQQFGIRYEKKGDTYILSEQKIIAPKTYIIEPDISAACYFYGLAAINEKRIVVNHVYWDCMQGDLKFIKVLEQMGCLVEETENGIAVTGPKKLQGVSVDLKDFSDQTMTLAAVAVFASGVTEIKNIGHIRFQESDRLSAILTELTKAGIKCEEMIELCEQGQEGIRIYPGEPQPVLIETYEDHRIAMAFSLLGTKMDGIRIANPACCGKTFENYFEVLDTLTQ